MKTKILLICSAFAPCNFIGAIRMSKFAKYLSRIENYEISVLTFENEYEREDTLSLNGLERVNIIRVSRSKLMKKVLPKSTSAQTTSNIPNNAAIKRQTHWLSYIKKQLREDARIVLTWIDECLISRKGKRYLAKHYDEYQYVISTFSSGFGSRVALWYKKRNPSAKWLADFRDPMVRFGQPKLKQRIQKSHLLSIIAHANGLMAVSEGVYVSHNQFIANHPSVAILENGYDTDDVQKIPACKTSGNDKLTFAYTGGLYVGRSDLSLFFRAIRELIQEKAFDINDIRIEYAGLTPGVFMSQASEYQLAEIVHNNGFVERKDSLEIQNGADALLLASWNTTQDKGIISGKVYEYLMMNKPIVCCVRGEVPNSKLSEMICKAKAGICCEEAVGQSSYDGLKDYISLLCAQWKNAHIIQHENDYEYIAQYDYKNLVRRLKKILDEL